MYISTLIITNYNTKVVTAKILHKNLHNLKIMFLNSIKFIP